jgi:hypothetical protein
MVRHRALDSFPIMLAWILTASVTLSSSSIGSYFLQEPMNFTVEGKISKLERNKFTINTEGNIVFHATYDEKTKFTREGGAPGSAKDLHVGLKIKVDGDLTESGEIVAHTIEIQEEREKPSRAS